MKRISIILCFTSVFYLTSCGSRVANVDNLPLSQGGTGEMHFVMSDYLWKGACGDSIRSFFSEPVWGLPAAEPMFVFSQRSEWSNFLQKFRNVLIVNVDPGFQDANIKFKTDVYAKNQVIFNIEAPSPDSLISCLYRNKDLISAYLLMKDRDAIIDDYKKTIAKSIIDTLKSKFLVDIVIPKSYTLYDNKDNFVWLNREEGEKNWHILMWEEPYRRTSQLDTDSLIFSMNVMTRKYVAGKDVGSYMADEPMIPPAVRRFEKDGIYTVQLNGLWQIENGYMGGPYVNQTIVDAKRGRLITGLGFIFYPLREKRHMVRQLEAILYTMTPIEDTE